MKGICDKWRNVAYLDQDDGFRGYLLKHMRRNWKKKLNKRSLTLYNTVIVRTTYFVTK